MTHKAPDSGLIIPLPFPTTASIPVRRKAWCSAAPTPSLYLPLPRVCLILPFCFSISIHTELLTISPGQIHTAYTALFLRECNRAPSALCPL